MAEQAGHWQALGDPHAGPFTAGSKDTELLSGFASSTADISSRGPLGSSTVDRHFSLPVLGQQAAAELLTPVLSESTHSNTEHFSEEAIFSSSLLKTAVSVLASTVRLTVSFIEPLMTVSVILRCSEPAVSSSVLGVPQSLGEVVEEEASLGPNQPSQSSGCMGVLTPRGSNVSMLVSIATGELHLRGSLGLTGLKLEKSAQPVSELEVAGEALHAASGRTSDEEVEEDIGEEAGGLLALEGGAVDVPVSIGMSSKLAVHTGPVSTSILSSVLGLEASNGSLFTSSSSESVLSSLSVLPELLGRLWASGAKVTSF